MYSVCILVSQLTCCVLYQHYLSLSLSFQKKTESRAHLLPFMMPAAEGELASLYNQVSKIMAGIQKKSNNLEPLKNLAAEWYNCIHYSYMHMLPCVSNSPSPHTVSMCPNVVPRPTHPQIRETCLE